MENRIYLSEFEAYKYVTEQQKKYIPSNPYFDLELVRAGEMRRELEAFIRWHGQSRATVTMLHEITCYRTICRFLEKRGKRRNSFLEWDKGRWMKLLKGWMLEEGLALNGAGTGRYGKPIMQRTRTIRYFDQLLEFLQPEDTRDEIEKDIWHLEKMNINIQFDLTRSVKTLNFTRIYQPDIREELKKAIYVQLSSEAVACVTREMTAMRRLSGFLKEKYPKVQSCSEIDRKLFEEYLLYLRTEVTIKKNFRSELTRLRAVLEVVGKIYGYVHLEELILNRDLPVLPKAEFKVYSDAELKRLNAQIVKMDEQIARTMIIHQMLGTRMSDTLTLEMDCLYERDGMTVIKIRQMKTHMYEKPISEELAMLIRLAMKYTKEKYGETKYIFVDDKNPKQPLKYTTIQGKVMRMVYKEDLRDDNGEIFGFGSHLYRHYYGVKLLELHLDDWTIAKLLGHRSVNNVRYYRKMSNQLLADETRKIRQKLSEMILENLDGWGAEYEQIRQDDCFK